jgi:hypothetical protein
MEKQKGRNGLVQKFSRKLQEYINGERNKKMGYKRRDQKIKADEALETKLHAFLPSSLDTTTEEIAKSGSCCGR